MTKAVGSTDLEITSRQRNLMWILADLRTKGNSKPTLKTLQKELQRSTRIQVSLNTIERDWQEINAENTYVKDLATKNYSLLTRQSAQFLEWVKMEAKKNYDKTWTQGRKITRTITTPKGDTEVIEDTTTAELAAPKAQFLRLAMDAEKLINDINNGRACDLSVVMMADTFRSMETENDIMKKNLESMASQ